MNTDLIRAKKLKEEGMSYAQIGKALGITKSAAYRLLQNEIATDDDDFEDETPSKTQPKSVSAKKSDIEEDLHLAYKIKKLELQHAREMREMEFKEESRKREHARSVQELEDEVETLKEEMEKLKRTNQQPTSSRKAAAIEDDDYDEEDDFEEEFEADFDDETDETDSETEDETDDETPYETLRNETFRTVKTAHKHAKIVEIPEKLLSEYETFVSEIFAKQGDEFYKSEFLELAEETERVRKKFKKFAAKNPFPADDIPQSSTVGAEKNH